MPTLRGTLGKMTKKPSSFEFGHNEDDNPQGQLFGGGSIGGDAPTESGEGLSTQPNQSAEGEGSSILTPPLQPKELRLARISMALADSYLIKWHYLHRTAKNSKIAFGIFARGELHGAMVWGLPVAKIKGQYGDTWTQLELRRMYCDPTLPKNSESRCLAVSARMLATLFPNCRLLVAYSDLSHGHRGGIYKAAGWVFAGRIEADKDGGWSKHPRHNRVETGDKFKWVKPIRENR